MAGIFAHGIREGVYDTPLAVDPQSLQPRGFEPEDVLLRLKRYALNFRDYVVGPMPSQQFLDEFLPLSSAASMEREHMRSPRHAFNAVPSRACAPAEIYEPLIKALNEKTAHRSRAPGLLFQHPSAHLGRSSQLSPMTPHICCYTTDNCGVVRRSVEVSHVELSYAEFFIEVRPDPIYDTFVDPAADHGASHEFLASQNSKVQLLVTTAWAKHIAHVSEILARQYRTFLFSMSVSGSRGRLFRWDRSGAVVTQSFDIREQPQILCEFLWRFSKASVSGRGHDLTVETASQAEEVLFRRAVQQHVRDQLALEGEELDRAVSEHYMSGQVMAIYVFAQEADEEAISIHRFLVSRPVISPMSPTGRGTRAYWAVHSVTAHVVFLKDTWRSGRDPEGTVLATLNEHGVRHVPKLVLHGDVFNRPATPDERPSVEQIQSTRTTCYASEPWVCAIDGRIPALSTYVHYRMVVKTVGYGIRRFRGTQELLHATYDVFQAMRDALHRCSRLHRDISIGNIILVKEPESEIRRGYLIDWDASIGADESGRAVEAGRAGTWSFMSIQLLKESEPTHTLQDDMESLVYVVLYAALHHLPHNLSADNLAVFIKEFFESSHRFGGHLMGGGAKQANTVNRYMTKRVKFQDMNFQKWLNAVLDLHTSLDGTGTDDEGADLWSDASHLDSFWKDFMATTTLASGNRVDNELPERSILSEVPTFTPSVSRSAVPLPPGPVARAPATTSAPREQPSRSSKRRRIELVVPLVPRRSQRLAAKTLPARTDSAQPSSVANTTRSSRSKLIPSSMQGRWRLRQS